MMTGQFGYANSNSSNNYTISNKPLNVTNPNHKETNLE